jgi:hypothetical protein
VHSNRINSRAGYIRVIHWASPSPNHWATSAAPRQCKGYQYARGCPVPVTALHHRPVGTIPIVQQWCGVSCNLLVTRAEPVRANCPWTLARCTPSAVHGPRAQGVAERGLCQLEVVSVQIQPSFRFRVRAINVEYTFLLRPRIHHRVSSQSGVPKMFLRLDEFTSTQPSTLSDDPHTHHVTKHVVCHLYHWSTDAASGA